MHGQQNIKKKKLKQGKFGSLHRLCREAASDIRRNGYTYLLRRLECFIVVNVGLTYWLNHERKIQ